MRNAPKRRSTLRRTGSIRDTPKASTRTAGFLSKTFQNKTVARCVAAFSRRKLHRPIRRGAPCCVAGRRSLSWPSFYIGAPERHQCGAHLLSSHPGTETTAAVGADRSEEHTSELQ